ncbi:DUF3306 domain-containing protein [Antarcticimicrobium sediminis]|uniref:DUF3306 domain-containing protein n=1 Tax=Antarcticimicrobium sediminis TaxID=2546227 RepID=A0A4V2Z8D8_9RHOB|nr:DUF3306 domain-containing protein [Antarcticimicrobium sediminis]TDE40056.1 DUF3306 domain-containing protein [Antarcticimicrobium sediminis]
MGLDRDTGDFWSRRRAAVRAEAEAEATARLVAERAGAEAERARAEADRPDEDLLRDLGLPDPDTLESGDDFAAFMQQAVPERLRRRALRRLWTSNPVLANLDGLTDYSDDFTDAAMVVPDMRTAYEVGRGMYEHVRTLVQDATAEATEADPTNSAEGADLDASATPIPDAPDAASRLRETVEQEVPVEEMGEQPAPATPARRHMRFAFES